MTSIFPKTAHSFQYMRLSTLIQPPRGQSPLLADDRQSLAEATDRFQIEYIRRLVEQCRGNMSVAAARLGLHRSNLYRKMRQLGMEIPRAEREEPVGY
ncbi:MAG: hypothetical protein IT426_12690 [Pirellulales bacterium]|nr:hypothetical protein [Pirellulales bacterium]